MGAMTKETNNPWEETPLCFNNRYFKQELGHTRVELPPDLSSPRSSS